MSEGNATVKRVVIAGCRNYQNYAEAKKYIDDCLSEIRKTNRIIIVSGCAGGADLLGIRYADENSLSVERYPADWRTYGKAAGPIRNKKMAEISDYVICFWDGKSKGTKSMLEYSRKYSKPIRIKNINTFKDK